MKKNYSPFKKGILTGFGFPGIGMSAAMFGFGVFAGEAGIDIYLCIGSLLILWSMPGMVIFVSLYTIGAPVFLLFTTVLLANMRQFFLVLSGMTIINIHAHKISLLSKLLWAHLISPTGWAELTKVKNELEEKELLTFFQGLTLALVTITSLTTIIGFKLYYFLPSYIVSIPVFIMPLYLTMLRKSPDQCGFIRTFWDMPTKVGLGLSSIFAKVEVVLVFANVQVVFHM